MKINAATETESCAEQAEALCFRQTKKCGRFDFFEATEGRATGCIKQRMFEKKFFLADMDYKYSQLTSKHYHESNKFVEILFLESVKGINWEYDAGKFPFGAGINVGLNRGNAGKLIFFPDVPIRGIKIMVFEEFYLNYLKDKLSEGPVNIYSLVKLNNQNYSNLELELVFKQIKHSMKSGITSELYYEGKIMEILYLVTSEIGTDSLQSHTTKRRLTVEEEIPETVELAVRANEEKNFLFLLNYKEEPAEIMVKIPLTELLSGKECSGEVTLKGYEAAVFCLPVENR